MKKFTTALNLFAKHKPNTEVLSIERTLPNCFIVETINKKQYSVDISTNKVEKFYGARWDD